MKRSFSVRPLKKLCTSSIKRLYEGEVFVFENVPEMHEICRLTKAMINIRTGGSPLSGNGPSWQKYFSKSSAAIRELCDVFESDKHIEMLFQKALHRCGANVIYTPDSLRSVVNTEDVHVWDRVRIRVQPFGDNFDKIENTVVHGTGRYSSTLPIHRDTWASNIMQQLNWWGPIIPVTEDRTLLLYPHFFDVPVPNTSERWDFDDLKRRRAMGKTYPQMPILDCSNNIHDEIADSYAENATVRNFQI